MVLSLGGHLPMETCGYQGVTSVQWGDPWPGALPKTLAERGSLILVGIAPFGIFAHLFEVEGLRGRLPRNVVGMRLRMATCDTGAVRQSYATAPLAV